MKPKVLFFLTAEFPYGNGETFIENEILFLANSFDKVVILPLNKSSEKHRPIPPNVSIQPIQTQQPGWLKVFGKIFSEPEILKEFFQNVFSNPLKNKILLQSIRNAMCISKHIEKQYNKHQNCRILFYSYWLDDGALSIAFLNRKAVKVSRAHRWDIYIEKHLYKYLPLRSYLAKNLSKIFSISKDGEEYLKKTTGQPDKISISRLGVLSRKKFNKNNGEPDLNLISISYVIDRKRVDLIGEAISLLSSKQIHWKHFGDGPELAKIKALFGFGEFYGHINNNQLTDMLEELSINSVLINTSTSEGIPVSMMEAMSFGIPCIGTNVGGVAEIIKDGVNGFLMPADPSPQMVSDHIKKYFELPIGEKELFRLNAFQTWEERYNAEKNYNNFTDELLLLDNE